MWLQVLAVGALATLRELAPQQNTTLCDLKGYPPRRKLPRKASHSLTLSLIISSHQHALVQVPAVGAWATLRELVLDECQGLREVTLSLPSLHTISLQSCPTLRSVRPDGPRIP